MVDAIGSKGKCVFCPSTINVVKTSLGNIDTYMCAICARKVIEEFALQRLDIVGLDTVCARSGQVLTFRFLDFRKSVHGGGNPAIVLDEINKFFQGAHATIINGRLSELRETQLALRRARISKNEKEGKVATANAASSDMKTAVARSIEEVARAQEEHDRLLRELEEKQKQLEAAVAERKTAEEEEAILTQKLTQLLGDAG
ncbi:hypothetical protein HY932_02765 [Candidatus Falkowbacteria bacterium]|nr:hypothetical protein [Candidatus Falkowbacteria bacterium]